MVEIVRGKDTGKLYAKLPGNRYVELRDEEQARVAQESTAESFARSFGNTIGMTVSGAGTLLDIEGQREAYDRRAADQALRSSINPISSAVGGIAPDIAAGVVTGGLGGVARTGVSGIARRAVPTAVVEGGLGAAQNPYNPVAGAATGAVLGGTVAGLGPPAARRMGAGTRKGLEVAQTVRETVATRASRRADIRAYQRAATEGTDVRGRNLSAAATDAPTDELSRKVLGDVYDSDEMLDRYGFPTSQAQKQVIDTRDPRAFNAARYKDKEDFDRWRSGGFWNSVREPFDPVDDYGALQTAQQNSLNKEIMRAMGDPVSVAATRRNIGDARKAISDDFNDIASRAGNLDMRETAILRTQLGELIEGETDDAAQRALQHVLDDFDGFSREGAMSAKELLVLRNRVAEDVRRAYGRNPDLVVGNALRDAEQAIDAAFYNKLPADAREDMKGNRFKWGVANTALRTAAATNARGDINIRSFINNYRTGNRRFKIGYDDNDFSRFLDTASAIMYKESRDSGTPAGMAPIMAEIGGALGVPGMGLLR